MKKILLLVVIMACMVFAGGSVYVAGGFLSPSTNRLGEVIMVDADGNRIAINSEGRQTILNYAHHEVHEGRMFENTAYFTALADNGIIAYGMKTGTNYAHIVIELNISGAGTYTLYEGALVTNGTVTTNASFNMNRASSTLPQTVCITSPLYTNLGTSFGTSYVPAGDKQSGVGGTIRPGTELIFNTNTWYVLVISNASGGAISGSRIVEWYEKGFQVQ